MSCFWSWGSGSSAIVPIWKLDLFQMDKRRAPHFLLCYFSSLYRVLWRSLCSQRLPQVIVTCWGAKPPLTHHDFETKEENRDFRGLTSRMRFVCPSIPSKCPRSLTISSPDFSLLKLAGLQGRACSPTTGEGAAVTRARCMSRPAWGWGSGTLKSHT